MTTEVLKEQLISEHKRDRNLTIISFSLLIIIIALAGFFLYNLILRSVVDSVIENSDANSPLLLIFAALPLVGLGYLGYRIYTINRRLSKINQLIEDIESGNVAIKIDEETIYKFTIPLLKINFKLKPIQYLRIRFSGNNNKRYFLPVPYETIQDFKTILSGANITEVNQSWHELYATRSNNNNTETTPLKSKQEFDEFVQSDLSEKIQSLEKDRKSGYKKQTILTIVFTIIGVSSWIIIQFLLPNGSNIIDNITSSLNVSPAYLVMGAFVIYGIVMFIIKQKNSNTSGAGTEVNHQFKTDIFKRMIAFINPGFKYILHGHIALNELLETGILEPKNYTIDGNDQIMGNYNGTPFQLCDLTVTYKANFSEEKEAPDNVFIGQIFIAQFNKRLSHELYIIPKKPKGLFKSKPVIHEHLGALGEKVILEDPEFMARYDVYSTDQIEARYIMSPSLMERILKMDTAGNSLYFSFKNDRISIANNNGRNNFETSMSVSLTEDNAMTRFYEELTEQLSIIDNLKLNMKIWK